MKDLETKQSVLDEIMNLMDEREGDRLKNHPKLLAAKVEIEKPKDELSVEGSPEEESSESPAIEKGEDELSPEMLQKLVEHFKDLK